MIIFVKLRSDLYIPNLHQWKYNLSQCYAHFIHTHRHTHTDTHTCTHTHTTIRHTSTREHYIFMTPPLAQCLREESRSFVRCDFLLLTPQGNASSRYKCYGLVSLGEFNCRFRLTRANNFILHSFSFGSQD